MSDKYSEYIIYVDESGDHSLTSADKGYPMFVLAFCIFKKESYTDNAVRKLKEFKRLEKKFYVNEHGRFHDVGLKIYP